MNHFATLLLALTLSAFAHDEGHGPKLSDAPKQGGVVAPVVLETDASKGSKAPLKYKAEIVRSQAGIVRVYLYDLKMNPLKDGAPAPKASGVLISGKKGRISEQKFELQWKGDHYEGISPKTIRKPYSIDLKISFGANDLFAAFDHLD